MKVKKNYSLFVSIIIVFVGMISIVFLGKPVEYMYEKIQEDLARNEDNYIPNPEIPTEYYSLNQYKIDVKNYSIVLDLDLSDKSIKGKTEIVLTKPQDLNEIDLNFYDNMNITRLVLNGEEHAYTHEGTRLSFEIGNSDSKEISVEIEYNGTPKNMYFGSFNFMERNGKPVVFTINEPIFASTWFPCNDIPNDKAAFEISIRADSGLTVASIGKLIEEIFEGDKKITTWKTEYPTSTYLMSFYLADYNVISSKFEHGETNIDLLYYVFDDHIEDATYDFSGHNEYLKFFIDSFGDYAFNNEKYGVAEFLWSSGAIENQTITGVGSNFITGTKFYENLFIHELAHHWWGNAVGPESWKDVWLNEGFATYSEVLFKEHKNGEQALIEEMDSKFGYYEKIKLYNPGEDLFNRGIYDKGAWVLHMLRKEVGEKNFWEILRNYYSLYKYKKRVYF